MDKKQLPKNIRKLFSIMEKVAKIIIPDCEIDIFKGDLGDNDIIYTIDIEAFSEDYYKFEDVESIFMKLAENMSFEARVNCSFVSKNNIDKLIDKRAEDIIEESKPIFFGNSDNSEEMDQAVSNAIFETKAAILKNIKAVEEGEEQLAYNKDLFKKHVWTKNKRTKKI